MEIILTDHAVDEFRRHLKTGGTPIEVAKQIALFFRIKPQLVHASTFTIPRKFGKPRSTGTSTYLARISWKNSRALLVLMFDRENYTAVTTLSNREFGGGVKSKRIIDIGEEPIIEKCLYKYRSLEMRVSPYLNDKGTKEAHAPSRRIKPKNEEERDIQKSHDALIVEAGSALPLDGGVKCLELEKR